ncbi:hypothetical protein MUP77_25400 [Candidatus Bathyarchaeota archaeon]|nr:hypothetical protein [Candidatus Bathyarchaeota archaeon]
MILKKMAATLPYLVSLIGVLADFYTTTVGLRLGLQETNAFYSPLLALSIFWGALTVLTLTLPEKRICTLSKNVLASISFIGAFNNTLVITGIFAGIKR